ncbi:hypothetical protein GF420_01065 [candidate division GN15 bacterium]|nr:hypothetical protein [candidate division GN15 bacterium]
MIEMKAMRSATVLLGIVLLAIACGTEKSVGPSQSDPTADYPSAVGSEWIYERYDSSSGTTDTLAVRLTSFLQINDGLARAELQYLNSACIVSRYLYFRGDTVSLHVGASTRSQVFQSYVFPLEPGNAWQVYFPHDSARVVARDMATVPAGTFRKVYVIRRMYTFFDSIYFDTIWFVPGVGIVQRHVIDDQYSQGIQGSFWRLLSYRIPE